MSSSLFAITTKLLSDEVISYDLAKTLSDYKNLILNATPLDLGENEHQTNIQLENGIAIGLNWAASCLDDAIRTQKFIRGTKLAIDQKLNEGKKPVQLLYAGTGPFATLILPLLSHFSSEELQVTLLDVNPASVDNVTKLIDHFGFENHVSEILCADATNVVLPPPEAAAKLNARKSNGTDILLSETMQHALQAELQVPITCHLLNQLPEDAILIPQSINLELVAIASFGSENESIQVLGELMKVDARFLRAQYPIESNWSYETQFKLSELSYSEMGFMAISTAIHVFKDERIEWNESGLTVPKLISPLSDLKNKDSFSLKYVIEREPGFQLLLH